MMFKGRDVQHAGLDVNISGTLVAGTSPQAKHNKWSVIKTANITDCFSNDLRCETAAI